METQKLPVSSSQQEEIVVKKRTNMEMETEILPVSSSQQPEKVVENATVSKKAKTSKKSKSGSGRVRSNVLLLKQHLKNINIREEHILMLKKTPFAILVESLLESENVDEYCNINKNLLLLMVNCLVKGGEKYFSVGKSKITIEEEHVRDVFGVKDGAKEIDVSLYKMNRTKFLLKHFPHKFGTKNFNDRLMPSVIESSISRIIGSGEEDDSKDVACLITLLVLSIFFLPKNSSYIPWSYVQLVSNIDEICEYNWSKHIVDSLLNGLEKRTNMDVENCAPLIPYVLCEKTNICVPANNDATPQFLKWNLSSLSSKKFASAMANILDHNEAIIEEFCSEEEKHYADDNVFTNLMLDFPIEEEHFENAHLQVSNVIETIQSNLRKDRENEINNLQTKINEILSTVDGLKETLSNKDHIIQLNDIEIKRLLSTIDGLKESIAEKDCIIQLKDIEIKGFISTVIVIKESVAEKEHIIQLKDIEIDRLKDQVEVSQKSKDTPTLSSELSPTSELHVKFLEVQTENSILKNKVLELEEEIAKNKSIQLKAVTSEDNNSMDDFVSHEDPFVNKEGSTLAKRVHGRLDRKKKRVGSSCEKNYERRKKIKKVTEIEKVIPISNILSLEARELLSRIYSSSVDEMQTKLYTGGEIKPVIIMEDIVAILTDKLEEKHIEAWSLMCEQIISKEAGYIRYGTVFYPCCWVYAAKIKSNDWFSDLLVQAIDDRLKEAMGYEILIFPINTTGKGNINSGVSDHWTLLVFSEGDMTWTLCNSFVHSTASNDWHLKRARILANYVERRMKRLVDFFPGQYKDLNKPKFKCSIARFEKSPQQNDNTQDCGVFVCCLIEYLLRGQMIPSSIDADKYRVKMTETFILEGDNKKQ